MINELANIDQTIFLFLNGMHNTLGDYFMSVFTGKWIWVPMYAAILYVLLRNFNWKVVLCCLVAITLTITFADQVCATFIRPVVERLRPSNPDNPISDLVHIVNGRRGGSYGFPSCHASNSFGLAFFLIFLFRQRRLSLFICLWAALNCYTRIYLGLHYPGDLLVGAIVGLCGAGLMYYLLGKVTKGTNFKVARQTNVIIYVGLVTTLGILIYAAVQTVAI